MLEKSVIVLIYRRHELLGLKTLVRKFAYECLFKTCIFVESSRWINPDPRAASLQYKRVKKNKFWADITLIFLRKNYSIKDRWSK
jgi:hypothetical protein